MKDSVLILAFLLPFLAYSQKTTYDLKSYTDEGIEAPNTHHIGDAWLNFLLTADDKFVYNITQATFSPNSTLDWHKHKTPQVIIVVEGKGIIRKEARSQS